MKENISFYELEKEVYRLVCSLGCSILKAILENYDKQLMDAREKKEYRHKGLRKTTVKTIMGEVEYNRAVYLQDKRTVYLLDDILKIATCKRVSANFVETALKTVVNTTSYRKAEKALQDTTNATLSHQELNKLVWLVGAEMEKKENEEIKLHREEKLVKGLKQIPALFEEADGLWFNLQGKDRKEAKEKYEKECKRKNTEIKENHKLKTEIKLHVMYEGWSTDQRHSLINKTYISGVMTPDRLFKLKNARIHQKYDIQKIELRASNGDGAQWINKIMSKDTITQKDLFHIEQEIVRDIKEKKYRDELMKIIAEKRYDEVHNYIENLKYELGGEEKIVTKLKTLQSYLKEGLPRYQDILQQQGKSLPKAPEGIEYRNMGTMESQIFTVLEVKLCSGRKAFLKKGANYLAKVCAEYYENNGEIKIEKIENDIQIDNSIQEWIEEIEKNVNENKRMNRVDRVLSEENNYLQASIIKDLPEVQEINSLLKLVEPTALMYR